MATEYLTKEGYKKLQDDLDNLRNVRRKEIAERLREAAENSLGEFVEDPEFEAAKNEQSFVEGRIKELEMILQEGEGYKIEFKEGFNNLDKEIKYVVYCDNGSRSAIAAYLLISKGFMVSHLKGGINKYQQQINKDVPRVAEPVNQIEYAVQPVVFGRAPVESARHQKEPYGAEAIVQTILSRHGDKDELSIALRTVICSVYKQLEQALKEKVEAEIARNIAEQKLESLEMQVYKKSDHIVSVAH